MGHMWVSSQGQNKTGLRPEYYPALDGIRGFLALIIAIYHCMWLSHIGNPEFLRNGPAVVDVFFVLSGFIMFTLYGQSLTTPEAARQYMKKRFARIYPLHAFMLIILLVFAVVRLGAHTYGIAHTAEGEVLPFQSGAAETLWSLLANVTLTHAMGVTDQLSYNIPSWSISVEFFAYMVFTLMILHFRPHKTRHFVFIAVCVGLNYLLLSRLKPDMNFHYDLGFLRCLGGFFTGILAAWALSRLRPFLPRMDTRSHYGRMSVLEAVCLSVMLIFIFGATGKAQFWVAPIAFVFVLVFAAGRGAVSRMFSSPVAMYLGKISYSMYMVHFIIAVGFDIIAKTVFPHLFGPHWNATVFAGDLWVLIYLGVVIFVSHSTYHWVEVKGRQMIMNTDISVWTRRGKPERANPNL